MSHHRNRFVSTTGLAVLILSLWNVSIAHAQLTGFVGNPTTNSTDFSAFVTSVGGTVNTNINFNSHPLGALQPTFYLASEGVTITTNQVGNTVAAGAGPGQNNTSSPPISPGEGLHPASNYLFFTDAEQSTVTFSFDRPISAFGLFTIDLYNTDADSDIVITAFEGQNGTGTQLGSFRSLAFNFQSNNLYFEGLADTTGANSISSVVVSRPLNGAEDFAGLDNVRFARATVVIPESSSVALVLPVLGLVGAVLIRRRKR